jgi:hypothetical protein
MTTERDRSTRIVLSWLREDAHENAEHVLLRALDEVDTTPQRRSWWPARRYSDMQTYAKVALAAAVAVAVVVAAISLMPRAPVDELGGPTALPSPSPVVLAFPPPGSLAIGRHSMTRSGIHMSIELATEGWGSNGSFKIDKNLTDAGFIFWDEAPDGVYENGCPPVVKGPESEDAAVLAAAITRIPGTSLVSGPTDVTVGGHPAKEVVISIAEDSPCVGVMYLWYDEFGGRWPDGLGDTMIVWIVEVDGALVWIDAALRKDSVAILEQEMRDIVASIEFE